MLADTFIAGYLLHLEVEISSLLVSTTLSHAEQLNY
jgi:hypothetical protein